MIRVYTASKLSRASYWRDVNKAWPHVYFHARWLKHNEIGTPDSPENAEKFWQEDQEDVTTADVLLLFAEKGEHLRGALVEVGIALANGIPVLVVGDHTDYGTWQYHPGVHRVATIRGAELWLQELDKGA